MRSVVMLYRKGSTMNKMRTRDVVLAVALAAGFIIHAIGADWSALSGGGHVILALLGLTIAFGAVGTMLYDHVVAHPIDAGLSTGVREPALSRFLFHDTRSAPLWLAVRLYVGIAWLTAGWEKIIGSPSWLSNGGALKGFWTGAVAVPKTGKPAISYDWYRSFLQFMLNHRWYDGFAKVICCGEVLIGIGLIVGGLTGIAAFFGALMNMSFLLAGSASTNPVLFTAAILLMLAWQVAGYWGADRFVLPLLGAPWSPGLIRRREHGAGVPAPGAVGD
jgi:thiosulfate dehydrogenase [quinone] large subunit